MLRSRHSARSAINVRLRVLARALLLALLLPGLSISTVARAQGDTAQPQLSTLRVPDTGASLDAFVTIDQWLRNGDVPEQAQPIDPAGTTAASVTIRVSGRVLGQGVAFADDSTASWQAARQAWAIAERSPLVGEGGTGLALAEIMARAMLEVEFAGTPIELAGDTFDDAALRVRPGLEGVMVRAGARRAAFFPARMRATGASPSRALRAACSEIALPPVEVKDLRTDHQAVLLRFAVQHVARIEPDGAPEFLHRGGRVVPQGTINADMLRDSALSIAEHLLSHQWQGEGAMGLAGDFSLTTGDYEPLVAPPEAQSLVALALARYAARVPMTSLRKARFERIALGVLNDLAIVEPDEAPLADDPSACAAYLCAWHSLPDASRESASVAASDLASSALATIRAAAAAGPDSRPPAPVLAMGAWGLAMASTQRPADVPLRDQARALVRELFSTTERAQLPALLPWLGWAEIELAGTGPVPSVESLLDARALMWSHQLDDASAGEGGADLVGGIVLSGTQPPMPTFHSARPLAFAGTMLGDARFTSDAERLEELTRLTAGLRFLVQLSVDSRIASICGAPDRALGGTRAALGDPAVSLSASALSLIAITEALHAAR